ncbi:MAG TPA: porin [Caulobacteraceae bacterium]|nr:porin [Caulobacteraceae bacterium]
MDLSVRRLAAIGLGAGLLAGVSTAALAQSTAQAQAAPTDARDARIEQLETEVRQLATEVQELKRGQQEQVQTLANTQNQPLAAPSANSVFADGRPSIASTDGQFLLNFHGIMQFDAAQYDQDAAGPISHDFRRSGPALGASASNVDLAHARHLKDGDDFRRARIGFDGTVYGDWDYRLIFDFGGTGTENAGQLYESWVQYSGLRPVRFRVGAFPPQIGMEDQASTNTMPFLERTVSSDLARGLAAGDTRTAAAVFANGAHWLVSGAVTGRTVGVINTGTASAVPQTFSDQLGLVGRAAGTPLHGKDWLVHVGVHGSYVARPSDASGPATNGATPLSSSVIALANTPELRVDGTKLINTGNIDARHASTLGAEFAAQKKNLLIQAEYEHFTVDRSDGFSSPDFNGYYVEGLWMLTGDARRYNAATGAFDGPAILHTFSPSQGAWGAWELGVRFSDMDLNYRPGAAGTLQTGSEIRGGDEQNLTVGLNWFPNNIVRFMFDYQHVRIDRLSPATTLTAANTIWFTPAGVQIGQSYDVFAIRSQFAF